MCEKTHVYQMKYRLKEIPLDAIGVWDEAQARPLDMEGIKELARSIKADGLQNPPLVQKEDNGYVLISGQRRLAACRHLKMETIQALVLDSGHDIVGAKATSLIENLQRRNMAGSEISKAIQFLVERNGKAKTRRDLGISTRTIERYLGFDAVPQQIKEMVPENLSRDHAIRLTRVARDTAHAVETATLLAKYSEAKRGRYLKAMADNPDDTHAQLLRKSNRYYNRNMRLDISHTALAKLASEAEQREMSVEKLVSEIVDQWLSRR